MVYLRVTYTDVVKMSLITSKTRVGPVNRISIPRMELKAAQLLAELMITTAGDMDIPLEGLHAWSDSACVLGWLKQEPKAYRVFVSNRIAKIVQLIDANRWRYVQSEENPADMAS